MISYTLAISYVNVTEALGQSLISLIFMATFPKYVLFIYEFSPLKTTIRNM